jgi:phage gp45-like
MHKATPNNTSMRAYSSGGSRGIVDTINDNTLMQEHSGQMMNSEARDAVESPQNYGHTSVSMPADKGPDGKISGSAENHISYSGGNRSFPVAGPMDDRRHRLRGLSPGDSAVHRTKDDDMQIHLTGDGMYHSAPQKVRMQLVPQGSGAANPPQNQAKASQAKRNLYATFEPRIRARLWAGLEPELEHELDLKLGESVEARDGSSGGSGSSSGSQSSQGGNKPTGQKAVAGAGADSKDFTHVIQSENRRSSQKNVIDGKSKEDDDILHHIDCSAEKQYLGGTIRKHPMSKVLTLAGPTKNVYGRLP